MALKRHQYPRNEPPVKAEGGPVPASASATNTHAEPPALTRGARAEAFSSAATEASATTSSATSVTSGTASLANSLAVDDMPAQMPALSPAAGDIVFRLLDYTSVREVRTFLTLLHAISAEADPYHFDKTPELIDRALIKARREENASNTFSGLALHRGTIVAVHVLRRFEEGPLIGAQVSGLWVAPDFRRLGVARRLKAMGEAWARSVGAHFLNSNVLSQNAPMLALNRDLGFENYRINLRKRL